jgi:hypothetical protein
MRTERADRAIRIVVGIVLGCASFDALAARAIVPAAGRTAHDQLLVSCTVLPQPLPVVSSKVVDGVTIKTIDY